MNLRNPFPLSDSSSVSSVSSVPSVVKIFSPTRSGPIEIMPFSFNTVSVDVMTATNSSK